MSPVRVVRRERRIRLDEPTATRTDSFDRAAERDPGHTPSAASDDGHEAGDAPLHAIAERRNAAVETFRAREGELLGRPVLAPADGLTAVVHQDAVRPPGLDERALLRLVLDASGRTVREHLAVEMAAALVQHAGAEGPSPTRRKQPLEV